MRDASLNGYLAVGMPGTVLGLERRASSTARMTRAALMAPAIALARDGFVLDAAATSTCCGDGDARLRAASDVGRDIPARHGKPYAAGERLVQQDLARTLRAISDGGADAFYRGAIAAAVAAASVVPTAGC